MTTKESQRARDTHVLSRTKGGTSQDKERNHRVRDTHVLSGAEGEYRQESKRKPASEGHSLSVERTDRASSGL
jgi:hypothetical protein